MGCKALTSINFPVCSYIGSEAFSGCTALSSINLPACKTLMSNVFRNCTALTTISLPACTSINHAVFSGCTSLASLYLLGSSVVKLSAVNTFNSTPIRVSSYLGYYGSIYVPASLLATYQASTEWSLIKSRFVGV